MDVRDFDGPISLGEAPLGFRGTVQRVAPAQDAGALPAAEVERRLIELGFIEGASVEVLHQGLIRRNPIAVRVNEATVALRRADAAGIIVTPLASEATDE
jgi:ferrous iron transport protein A